MAIPAVLTPLVTRVTLRRGLHLVLGAVVLVPYVLLGLAFARMYADRDVPLAPRRALPCS